LIYLVSIISLRTNLR